MIEVHGFKIMHYIKPDMVRHFRSKSRFVFLNIYMLLSTFNSFPYLTLSENFTTLNKLYANQNSYLRVKLSSDFNRKLGLYNYSSKSSIPIQVYCKLINLQWANCNEQGKFQESGIIKHNGFVYGS